MLVVGMLVASMLVSDTCYQSAKRDTRTDEVRAPARGIVAEPPVGAGLAPARVRSTQRVMERIARREAARCAAEAARPNHFALRNID